MPPCSHVRNGACHIPVPLNFLGDDISRWDGSTPVPGNFLERNRIRISLAISGYPMVPLLFFLAIIDTCSLISSCDVSLFLFPLSHLLEIHSQLVRGMLAIEFPLIAFMGFQIHQLKSNSDPSWMSVF